MVKDWIHVFGHSPVCQICRLNKDRAFRRTPGRRCQACFWCIIENSWKRRHHHGHMEHKATTLTAARKLQEPTHEMDMYGWNILGLSEMRWQNFGKTTIEEGDKVFFSGKEEKHEHGVGFLVHKDIVNTVMGCLSISSRLITILLRAVLFNFTIVKVYAQTSDCDDNEIEEFYDQLQNFIDQTPRKGILVVPGDWNTKVGMEACEN